MSKWLEQLANPPAPWRGAPFWAWNSRLDKAELVRQVGELARAGMGGFFMHVRYGLETEYMSAEFLDCVKAVVAEARKRRMEAWLYDEDRWPSGFAGGAVTAGPEFRIKFLLVESAPAEQFTGPPADALRCFSAVVEGGQARDVQPLLPGHKPPPGRTVLVYRACVAGDVGWFNNTAYLDTMDVRAVRAFIDATHEVYKRAVGGEFGRTIPGIFTDEPNVGHFRTWGREGTVAIPWTGRLADEFRKRFGYDLLDRLVELTHNVEGVGASSARHDYRRLVTELYTEAFSRQIGEWCAANNLELTGHELQEQPLSVQIDQAGACMPHYEFFQRPGIDILTDRAPEVLTAKQCVSVASQLGRTRVLSELYGCTGWDATFEMYKHIGDWHQVLGVNHFCPHLSWYSMAGGAKRDYPAGIFYQSPWWPDYRLVNDYFAKLSLALSQGRAVREVLVIHPIESAWLVHTRQDPSGSNGLSQSLERLCFELLDNQFDFDFADESMLPGHASVEPGPRGQGRSHARFTVGKSSYRAVVVPESLTLRASTVELLERFADGGGKVVFVGRAPTLVDCQPSDSLAALVARCARAPHSVWGLADALGEGCRPARIKPVHYTNQDATCWVHLRRIDDGELLFVHHRNRLLTNRVRIEWAGAGVIREIDPLSGAISDVDGVETSDGRQVFQVDMHPTGSRLYLRTPAASPRRKSGVPGASSRRPVEVARINCGPVWDYALDEPNAMTLDCCRARVVGTDRTWRSRKLIWQHERDLRKELGFRDNTRPAEQPYIWMRHLSPRSAIVELEFEIPVEAIPAGPLRLAIEQPERFEISLNGKVVRPGRFSEPGVAEEPAAPLLKGKPLVDWFIDRSIRIVPLAGARLKKGTNRLVLRTDYREHHWLEEVYLLGRFGVRAAADQAIITRLPRKLAVGDWCGQGLAMYSGAVAYGQQVRIPRLTRGQRAVLCLDRPKATVIRVTVNGRRVGTLGWQPWRIDITRAVKPGLNRIEIAVVSSRRNLLGPLHHVPANPLWTGPAEFRTEGPDNFTPSYNLVQYGLLGEAYVAVEQQAL